MTMANFYAYKKDTDTSVVDHVYKELQLHQFASKRSRDDWVGANANASTVKVSDIPVGHMNRFMEFGKSRRADGGFWCVVG
jgi:hypothetical protein